MDQRVLVSCISHDDTEMLTSAMLYLSCAEAKLYAEVTEISSYTLFTVLLISAATTWYIHHQDNELELSSFITLQCTEPLTML